MSTSVKYQDLKLSYKLKLLPILPNELLRSWIVRNALFLNMKPSQLSTVIFRNSDIWKSDIDTQLSQNSLVSLLDAVDISQSELDNILLISSKSDYFYPHLNESKQLKWVLSMGVHKRDKNSIQYCPQCLLKDRFPYYRNYWRLGFITVCRKHNLCLLDKCHVCCTPISLLRYEKSENSFRASDYLLCQSCSASLVTATQTIPHDFELMANDNHYSLLNQGHGQVGNMYFQYSHLYFDGLKRLLSLFLCHDKAKKLFEYIIDIFKLDKLHINNRDLIKNHSEIEHLCIELRRVGIIFSHYMMENWPKNFISLCKEKGVTRQHIYSSHLNYPFWFKFSDKNLENCDLK